MASLNDSIALAFQATDDRAGQPTISHYPGGAWSAVAAQGGIQMHVTRTAEGVIQARYINNTMGIHGVSTLQPNGSSVSQSIGEDPGNHAYDAAKSLALRIREIYQTPGARFSPAAFTS